MMQRHNLLLLDEPTNHLDLDSREALEESLENFPGSIVFVSHDRAFIDRLATRVLDLRAGRAVAMDGNYSETAEKRAERRKRPEPARGERGKQPAPDPVSEPSIPRPAPAARAERRDKGDGHKRRRRLQSLEERIAALEGDVDRLEARLWDEALTLGPVESRNLAAEKAARREELDGLVEEWANLSRELEESDKAGSPR
jgi:ATP-binding cassette subfamily F protein 3